MKRLCLLLALVPFVAFANEGAPEAVPHEGHEEHGGHGSEGGCPVEHEEHHTDTTSRTPPSTSSSSPGPAWSTTRRSTWGTSSRR